MSHRRSAHYRRDQLDPSILPFPELAQWLGEQRIDEDDPVVALAHLAMPRPDFTDRGKSRLALPSGVQTEMAGCPRDHEALESDEAPSRPRGAGECPATCGVSQAATTYGLELHRRRGRGDGRRLPGGQRPGHPPSECSSDHVCRTAEGSSVDRWEMLGTEQLLHTKTASGFRQQVSGCHGLLGCRV